jgi:hypothetical protein
MKGPNIGTSGGPHAVSEGLIAAISLMGRQDCEGVWLVVTEWAGELLLDATGLPTNDPSCRGLAIAITHEADAGLGLTLHCGSHESGCHETAGDSSGDPVGSLAALAAALEMCRSGEVLESWSHRCPWGMEVRIASRRRGDASPPYAVPPAATMAAAIATRRNPRANVRGVQPFGPRRFTFTAGHSSSAETTSAWPFCLPPHHRLLSSTHFSHAHAKP